MCSFLAPEIHIAHILWQCGTDCKLSLMIIMKMMSSACRNNNGKGKKCEHEPKVSTYFFRKLARVKNIYRYLFLIEDDVWSNANIQNICAISRSSDKRIMRELLSWVMYQRRECLCQNNSKNCCENWTEINCKYLEQ